MAKLATKNVKAWEGQTYTIGLHDLVRALKVIEKHGHMAKFLRAAKHQQAAGTFGAKTVNFIQDFMVKHEMYAGPIGKHIANARGTGRRQSPVTGSPFEVFSPLPGDRATRGLPRPRPKVKSK
jgi:hypothetical protein